MKGLIIDEPWISLILAGKKTWEMRSRHTSVRGRIALVRKGSKQIVGVADLVKTLPQMSVSELRATVNYHCVPERDIEGEKKHNIPWVLCNARPLREPVTYRHPAGAVIWVDLDAATVASVVANL